MSDYAIVMPEIIMAVAAMALLMLGAYGGEDKKASLVLWLSAGLMAAMGIWIAMDGSGVNPAFGGSFVDDAYARFACSPCLRKYRHRQRGYDHRTSLTARKGVLRYIC